MKHKHCEVIKAWADGSVIQIKHDNDVWSNIQRPTWNPNCEYRASLAIVEGKPVFEGDVLYFDGTCVAADIVVHRATADCIVDQKGGCWSIDKLHWTPPLWTPPKPKTVTVELLQEDVEYFSNFLFLSIPFKHMQNAFKEALK